MCRDFMQRILIVSSGGEHLLHTKHYFSNSFAFSDALLPMSSYNMKS